MNHPSCEGSSLGRRTMACVSAMALATGILLPGAASAQGRQEGEGRGEGRVVLAGNGPGPAANGPGPGCNIIPPLASTGTKVDISQFPPADSLTDPELAGPVQLLKSGKFDIPIEALTGINVPSDNPRGTITLPLFKGAVKTPSGPKPAWYIILDAGNQDEATRLGVNFSKPSVAQPGSIGDADYSPLVNVDGIIYDAPVVAAAVEDGLINFPNGNPNYALVHDQVVAIDPVNRTVTLSLINGFSFGKPVFYISTESSDPTVSAIEGNTFAPRPARDYSPVWDANLYEWTEDAIDKGYRGLLTEEFRILKLARDGYITGPNGAPFGSAGPVIVCGVAARLN